MCYMQPPPGTFVDEGNQNAKAQVKNEDRVADVGSIRTFEPQILSEIARAPLPNPGQMKQENEGSKINNLLIDIGSDKDVDDGDDVLRESWASSGMYWAKSNW